MERHVAKVHSNIANETNATQQPKSRKRLTVVDELCGKQHAPKKRRVQNSFSLVENPIALAEPIGNGTNDQQQLPTMLL